MPYIKYIPAIYKGARFVLKLNQKGLFGKTIGKKLEPIQRVFNKFDDLFEGAMKRLEI